MVMKAQKANPSTVTDDEQLLQEAAIILQKFVVLTEYGPLQGCNAHLEAKEFLNKYVNYLQ